LSGSGQGQVFGCQPLHAFGLRLLSADHVVDCDVSTLVAQYASEHFLGRRSFGSLTMGGLRIGVVGVN
jgi:hypothetical protein